VSPFLPRLTVVPPVGPPGIAVAVEGDGFPPGTPVQVRWTRTPGDTTGPVPLTQVIRTTIDGSGHLPRTYLLVFPRDILGLRMVEVTGDRPDASASVDFVVVPGPFQPWANVMSFVRPDLIARR
jgi:hypothetical protein